MPVKATIERRVQLLWIANLRGIVNRVIELVWKLFPDTLQSEAREMRSLSLIQGKLLGSCWLREYIRRSKQTQQSGSGPHFQFVYFHE